jgi:cell division protein FtsI (penicillin-binding protein 3)
MKTQKAVRVQTVAAWRRKTVLGLLALGALIVIGRAFHLQVIERDFLTSEGAKRHVRTVTLAAHRGAILDRRGEPLALSAPVDSIWAVPSALLASPEHLAAVAKVIKLKPRELTRYLEERATRQFVYLHRHLPPDEARRVLAIKAPGVFAQREYRRYYPAGEVAAQVVGLTDVDGRGREGMEAAHDAELLGTPGTRRVIRDARGRIVEDTEDAKPAQPGRDLRLSIDLRLQYLAYRELKAAVAEQHAKGGLVVVADSKTGEILAVASQPGFNPNNADERDSRGLRNRAIVDSFEPGSTVKPLLVAQALEIGAYRPTDHIDTTPGTMKVGRLLVRDVHPQGDIDLGLILAKSSNVGAAKIGLKIGAENVWAGYQKFGLGERVASGFPGESLPLLRPSSQWGEIATATASYGYGLSVNALHLVRAYSALANDGLMPQLRLTTDQSAAPPQRAISAATAREMRHLLESVTLAGGTGSRAAVAGYRVAGKTGTVRKVSDAGGYDTDRYQAVFVGMVPAERPRLVGFIMLDEPGGDAYYGGVIAAPVFSHVMQGALRLLQIAPDACSGDCPAETTLPPPRTPSQPVTPPPATRTAQLPAGPKS